jgi:hypothetical protein
VNITLMCFQRKKRYEEEEDTGARKDHDKQSDTDRPEQGPPPEHIADDARRLSRLCDTTVDSQASARIEHGARRLIDERARFDTRNGGAESTGGRAH